MTTRLTKLLALVLALCLMPMGAWAQEDDVLGEAWVQPSLSSYPDSLIVLQDTLYALISWQGLYQQVEDGWIQALDFYADGTSYDALQAAAFEDSIYLLTYAYDEEQSMAIMSTTLQDGRLTPLTKLTDVDLALGEDAYPQLYGMAADAENVWLLLFNDQSSMSWGLNELWRVSLTDGTATRMAEDYLSCLQPYTEDKLLAYYWDQENAYSGDEVLMPNLVTLDKITGDMTALCTLQQTYMGGLTYDSATGYIYIADEGHLYRYDDSFAGPELCAYLAPGGGRSDIAAAVLNGVYYYSDYYDESCLSSCTVDPALLPTRVLRMNYNYGSDELLRAFCKEHPDIALETGVSDAYTAEEISRAMTSGDNSADIFSLYLSNGIYEALRDKGYCYDLSGSEVISGFVDRMYPQLAQVLSQDGKLYAIPCTVYASGIGYYPAALEKVGLTEDDLPSTMMELLDFFAMWGQDYADEYLEIQLFEGVYDLYEQLFGMMFEMQINLCNAQGETLTFDTDTMRKLLARLEEIKPVLDDMNPDDSSGDFYFWDGDGNVLFSAYADLLPSQYGHSEWEPTPLLLSLDEGLQPALTMNMSVYIVNPNSENADLAIMLMEYLVENMDQDAKIALLIDENEPLEYFYYAENMANAQEWLESVQEAMATASEEDLADWQEQLSYAEEYVAQLEASRWAISEEDIAHYREIAPYLVLPSMDIFSSISSEASTLIQRYLDGQISAEQFITEFSRIILMIQMENE